MDSVAKLLGSFNYYDHAEELEPILKTLADKREKVKTNWRSGKIRYGTFYLVENFGWHLIPPRASGGYRVADGLIKIEIKENNKWQVIWEREGK